MANIYLQVSSYVAAFWRSMGNGESRPKDQPLKFSKYTHSYAVLYNGLRIVPLAQQHRASCYSQAAWSNMLSGRMPNGGKALIKRNKEDYLTYAEVCTLDGKSNRTKVDAYDFLCIEIPREVMRGTDVVRTSKAYTLDSSAANELRDLLKITFVKTFLEYEQANIDFAKSKGIKRSSIEIIERFFAKYDMPVSHSNKERESLRRLAQRWRKDAYSYYHDASLINDPSITRIDDYEIHDHPNYEGGEDDED